VEELGKPNADPDLIKSSLGLVSDDTIFVANLPENCSINELKEFFGQFGTVKEVRIPIDHSSGKARTIGFVSFREEKVMLNALRQDGIVYKDKKLRINKAEKKGIDTSLKEKYGKGDALQAIKTIKEDIEKQEERLKQDFDQRFRRRDNNRRDGKETQDNPPSLEIKRRPRNERDKHDHHYSQKNRKKSRSPSPKRRSRSRSGSKERDKRRDKKKNEKRKEKSRSRSRSRSKERNQKKKSPETSEKKKRRKG